MAFYHIQITILRNTLRTFGPIVSLLLLGVGVLVLYGISHLSPLEVMGICVSMTVGVHVSRGDKMLLQSLYHGRQRSLIIVEYAVLSLPFVLICLWNGHLFYGAGCLTLSAVVFFIPRISIGFTPFSHPLLPRGAYQYRNTMRILLVPYLAMLVVSTVGLAYGNPDILQACLLLMVLLVGYLLCQPLYRHYLLPYITPMRIVTLQLRYAFISALVLLLPLVVLHMAYFPSFDTFVGGVKALLLAALFFYLCECVRYLRLGNDLLNMMVTGALFMLLLACYMRPIVLTLAVMVTVGLSVNVYQSKKNYG